MHQPNSNPIQYILRSTFRTTNLASSITTIFMSMARYLHGKDLQMSDPLHTWKLQALATTNCPATTPYSFCFQQTQTDFPPLNYNSAAATGEPQQCKRKRSNEPGNWVSSRWNPTPEQLQCLEELYCSGTRTPTAKQIQQIAAKLRRFGKIEGKNVFYWFQNHKSRERQKLHRKMNLGLSNPGSVRKQTGLSRASVDHRQAKNWASLSNSCTSSEESVSLQRAVVAACNVDKGIKFEERQRELQQRGSRTLTVNATWQKMEMPSATTCTTATETLLETRGQMLVKSQIFDRLARLEHDNHFLEFVEDERRRESQTLQLFPVSNQVLRTLNIVQDDAESFIPAMTANPIQCYEFFL